MRHAISISLCAFVPAVVACAEADEPADPEYQSLQSPLLQTQEAFAFYQPDDWDPERDAYNPAGGTTVYPYLVDGLYFVIFEGMHSAVANVQVTAVGDDDTRCRLGAVSNSGSVELLLVVCQTADGRPAPSGFSVYYTQGASTESAGRAFVLADQPSNTDEYEPANSYGSVRVRRLKTGVYRVSLDRADPQGGNFQVTAVGPGNNYCKVRQASEAVGNLAVVACYHLRDNSQMGVLVDSQFSLLYTNESSLYEDDGAYMLADPNAPNCQSPNGEGGGAGSMLCSVSKVFDSNNCIQPDSVQYVTPNPSLHYTTVGFSNQQGRIGPPVTLVTAHGADSNYCKVRSRPSISESAPTEVQVRCFTPAGADAEPPFMISIDAATSLCAPGPAPTQPEPMPELMPEPAASPPAPTP